MADKEEKDIFPDLVEKLYEVEAFWTDQVLGLQRQLHNAQVKSDITSKQIADYEKLTGPKKA